jgi:hypothetical protein
VNNKVTTYHCLLTTAGVCVYAEPTRSVCNASITVRPYEITHPVLRFDPPKDRSLRHHIKSLQNGSQKNVQPRGSFCGMPPVPVVPALPFSGCEEDSRFREGREDCPRRFSRGGDAGVVDFSFSAELCSSVRAASSTAGSSFTFPPFLGSGGRDSSAAISFFNSCSSSGVAYLSHSARSNCSKYAVRSLKCRTRINNAVIALKAFVSLRLVGFTSLAMPAYVHRAFYAQRNSRKIRA